MDTTSRRDFLKTTAAGPGGAVAASAAARAAAEPKAAPQTLLFKAPPIEHVRVGFVGVGGMGTNHLDNYLALEGVTVAAVCDIDQSHAERARKKIVDAGQPEPKLFTRGERDFERMCGEQELDLVFNATPWEWHVPVMLAALKAGKHAATEVPAAYRVDDCWALVEAAEKYKQARGDDGELLLRPARDADADAGPQGHLRRPPACRVRLPPRSAVDQVLEGRRRPVAPGARRRTQRQPLSDPRARADRAVLRHQPRQPVRLPGVDEQPIARPAAVERRASARRRPAEQGGLQARRRQRQR